MNFENDIFVSYAHIDDQALVEGQKGWISSFHRALEVRLAQLLGREPRIWRDPKLQGNDIYSDRLVQCLPGVAVLVSVVSPRYVRSDWCMRELKEFVKATSTTGGTRRGDKARVFKIVKTPVPLVQQPADFQELLGYDFFVVDAETGRAREVSQTGDAEAQRLYWMKLDDLAHDIAEALENLEPSATGAEPTEGSTASVSVYLAETSFDLREERDVIKRELMGHGHLVLPDRPLPLVGPDCEDAIREQLARCSLSIHLIGKNYGLIPEGVNDSIVVMQNELAIERGTAGEFSRLIWLPPDLSSDEERQTRFIDLLQTDVRIQEGADLLQTSLEDFKSVVLRRTQPEEKKEAAATAAEEAPEEETEDGLVRVYVIYDQRDGDGPAPVEDYLFKKGFEVIVPVFDGDEAQVRRDHEENLSICDGVLLYYGAANELWLRRKLREIQKSAAFGRKGPIGVKAIFVAPPETPTKKRLRTREALVVDQREGFDPEALEPFVYQLQSA
jgi:hypothetical protein